ncbi:MAG: hypothetical protein IGS39_07335 [Calothrix sp. C42_A2020_038]|nr:hypothetical protein [Calothrix sp. C42_A2020_038]
MANKTELVMVISYIVVTCCFLLNWLMFAVRHPSSSVEDTFLSFVMCCITTVLWPLIIPMSLVEIAKKRKLKFTTAVPVIGAILALSLSLYLN